MSDPALTDRIITQDKALVRAIEALGTIEPSGPFERTLARLLQGAYKRRLRAIVETAPDWVVEKILSASGMVGRRCGSARIESGSGRTGSDCGAPRYAVGQWTGWKRDNNSHSGLLILTRAGYHSRGIPR